MADDSRGGLAGQPVDLIQMSMSCQTGEADDRSHGIA
jgi:hypothetical protein